MSGPNLRTLVAPAAMRSPSPHEALRHGAALVVACVAACGSSSDDIVGPFTGDIHRFVVDSISIPRDSTEAAAFADDLDGDGDPENKFGYATAVLATTNDLSPHAADMIASGALGSVVEIHADSLTNDDAAGVYYLGAGGHYATSALAIPVGGQFVDGAFAPNRTRTTRHPAASRRRSRARSSSKASGVSW